jgi:CRP-like cAMP-binding protein
MYATVSGRLQLFLDGEDGTEEFLAELRSGDTVGEVGEMGLIDGQPD